MTKPIDLPPVPVPPNAPCPFCATGDLSVEYDQTTDGFTVVCANCVAEGPASFIDAIDGPAQAIAQAIADWNERPPMPRHAV